MKDLFGIFFIWLSTVLFQKLPTIWAAFISILEFVGDSINTTPASTTAFDDDDRPGITSIFDDSYCTTCSNMVCRCHTGSYDDPFHHDDSSSLFDDSHSLFDDRNNN